ncbi:methyltransferase domain-containing protein [Mycolicibacterium sp. CBMA 226]|uniref:methyltransferase domain-containing protein n=1 Tax=Mycolicibacterium sp. CBMA 226 TaxID=2606611 RepID=UPI0012DC6748|nr:methyltransferase domain-containing protein [Mycolicibacterium sp. CBMA 226]MUL76277.1 methyltransferase domain-containing protein [Mycolicibacterium sp. CBMA 226]
MTDATRAAGDYEPNSVYSLGANDAESGRLRRQAEELLAASTTLIDRVGLAPGDAAIDLGCGPTGILELLHDRVGPSGRVVGVDADSIHVAMAADMAAARKLSNVEVMVADARNTGLPSSSFDVVHARLLLINIPEPAEVLGEMVRLAKPGGWILSLEADCECSICYPPHPAYQRLVEMFAPVFTRNGADWRIGRRLAELYRSAGLTDVRVEARADVYPLGHTRRTIRVDLIRTMKPHVLQLGLATEAELEELCADALGHLDNPDAIVMPHLNFLLSGRKPA